ncbi:MAG: HAMP domain-containing histidine kinase [Lachnospiraceae bacterium]|nr:HAMP domain-containing histidine kinase [Lachnospiraceae bacterium]
MIKKLRKRFILTAALAAALVLIIMMGSINLFNYRSVTNDADTLLAMIAENGGIIPDNNMFRPDGSMRPPELPGESGAKYDDDKDDTSDDNDDEDEDDDAFEDDRQEDGGDFRDDRDPDGRDDFFFHKRSVFSEETRFESRFFSVTADGEGKILSVSTENIAAVSSEEAREYAMQVLAGKKTSGFADDYRYLVKETNGGKIVVFLDCSRSLGNAHSFLLTSLLVSLAAFALVMILIVFASGKILRPVEESYRKQKGFITDAGHELKTPVAVIGADAAVLEMEIGENEWLSDIKKQTGRLADLTGELTYLARMDEGRTDTVRISFPISDVVEETASSFQSRAIVDGKRFAVDTEPMLEYTGDEAQIRKLVSILLDNAVKYSTENGEISLKLRRKNKNILLTVFNTAEHVDAEMCSRMFDRFYRGDLSRSSENGGFGIGLSIAQSIAEAHHGKISAAPKGENGIEITVQL